MCSIKRVVKPKMMLEKMNLELIQVSSSVVCEGNLNIFSSSRTLRHDIFPRLSHYRMLKYRLYLSPSY
jgi:hypothetical protein